MSRRKPHYRHDARPTDRHELFTSGETMMSVHFTEAPTPEARAVFQKLVDKIASGEITLPLSMSDDSAARILDVRRGAGLEPEVARE